jgi:outer membrane protein OmpA-like peptidoglycan-associated protein
MIWSDYDRVDGASNQLSNNNPEWNENDLYLKTMVGLSYNLGKAGDDDGDGIVNSKDACPNVAGLQALNGCPDADGDGITDANDKCPNTYGIKAFMGCPDSDSDGIADSEDACPNLAGPKELNGCPDSDGDGVADKADACPEIAGLKELAGCPDSDGDGVADKDDACPDAKGPKENEGCPDTDGDGVADNKDLCPDVVGIAKNKGCPEVKKEELKILKEALYGIKFEVGKATITPNSYTILENVYSILEKTPQYKLQIHGHTDSDGADEMNMKLSKDRAASVKTFLEKKGIEKDRLTSEGFGETKPVATNDTRAGKAQNRRVELEIKF